MSADLLLTFGLLMAAIVLVPAPGIPVGGTKRVWPWQLLFVLAIASGLIAGHLKWIALPPLAALWWSARSSMRASTPARSGIWLAVASLLALGLALHLFPGFANPVIAANVLLGNSTAPLTLRANFDKGAVGLLLFVYCCHRIKHLQEWPRVAGTGVAIGAVTSVVVIGLVVSLGVIRFDPKLLELAWVWMPIGLFLSCLAEEAFFRGIVQQRLADALQGRPLLRWIPIAVASVLFGLAHVGGGPILIVAATLAGVGYGWAYARTGRIEAAVLAHFTLNAIHFFGFTYPFRGGAG